MKRPVYTGLHYLMMPLVVGRLKWLARKNPAYGENIRQRFGHTEKAGHKKSPLWIHAVSVGETIASEPLVKSIQTEYPDLPILMTSTTPTGADQVKRLFGDSVDHQFAPYDLPGVINRFVEQVNPCALVVMETELWPNWIKVLAERDIPIIVANARMSEKSAAGYQRLGEMSAEMMKSINLISAQYQADANRFDTLGASPKAVKVLGNIKADIQIEEKDRTIASEAQQAVGSTREPVIIAASTHPGEDEIILDALLKIRSVHASTLLYLVPRHPERAKDIESLIQQRGLGFVKRSDQDYSVEATESVVLCDKLGELRGLFGATDIVLMGGTLVDHGGHNPLEPAAWGLPILAGPSQRNFDSLFSEMQAAGALLRVEASADAIADEVIALCEDASKRDSVGEATRLYLDAQKGAVNRLRDELRPYLSSE